MLQRNKSQTASGIRLDRRDLESRAKSIEQSLSALESHTSRSSSSASSSKVSAHQLVNSLSDAINEIISSGSELERDNMSSELNAELTRLSETGRDLIRTAAEFADEPSSAAKKTKLAASSKLLLQSLSRLLAIADLLDAHAIRPLVDSIACALRSMSEMRSIEAFLPAFKRYNDDLKSLINLCSIAIQNLSDQHMKNDLASSLGQLAKQSLFLYTSSKIYLKHQNSNIASSLHEQVYKESIECISKIEEIFSNQYKPDLAQLKPFTIGLVDKFNNLEKHVAELNPTDQNELKKRQKFENQVEDIIKSINTFVSKDLILPERKNRIMDEANTMKMSLHAFFDSYSDNAKKNNSKMHENIQNEFGKIIKSLKRQLRKAVIEKISTMPTNEILDELIFAAQSNQNGGLSQALASFESHAKVWSDLGQMACALSSNQEGIKMAKMARKQLDALLSYVLSSAQIYASFGAESKEASENMQVIRSRWLSQCEVLQLAIDDIVCINDFLAVYEYQLHRELNKCIGSLGNLLSGTGANELKSSAHQVATKVSRIGEMIEAEMNNYEPCAFTSRVLESINSLSTRLLPSFSQSVEALDHELSSSTYGTVSASNENELIEYARLIYDSVRDMRSALFMIPGGGVEGGEMVDYSADFDDEYDEHLRQQQDRSSLYCMDEAIGDVDEKSQAALTDEQREKINAELSSLRKEKTNFDREVLKWDDQSNEIVVLAKQIAVIMMDMVKFTRGVGPYKTTLDIINAAKRINEIGLKLEKLCRKLASECPESQSKKELISYLNALPLFCNQLSIGTRVQENIIDPNTAKHLMLITSATSLIISSKNLMNTVISVVKSSYVASTKYSSKTDNKKPIVQWRMKPPELKPLVTKSKAPETADLIRKATKAVAFSPIKTLSEFQGQQHNSNTKLLNNNKPIVHDK